MKFFKIPTILLIWFIILNLGCKEKITTEPENEVVKEIVEKEKPVMRTLHKQFKDYWYAGKAEITSFKLQQARYGELREGHAVLIYVTEDFLPEKQVKADRPKKDNLKILKLNSTKNFLTGIYPYSIMTSTFHPVFTKEHAVKVSNSVQEWCGQVYMQLNNRDGYEINAHSYFEGEADQFLKLEKEHLENELWTQIRIAPDELPKGNIKLIPSMEFLRLQHKEIKAYEAVTSLENKGELSHYIITYPELKRTVTIMFQTDFPHGIEGWTDIYTSGYGSGAKTLTSTAIKLKTLKTDYWTKNKNTDAYLRNNLGL
ncbi:septum formation inhibitor Maf [Ascidiimonas aurantiaca]|uniref:septum formation inhibitor Maf n=1 Tax=Ascidiimonas aurantiaca TaxID=1685432 RepID=UPI0030EEA10D